MSQDGMSYAEKIKQQELHSITSNSDVEAMLSKSPTNCELNNDSAKNTHVLAVAQSCWKGSYSNIFSSMLDDFTNRSHCIDGDSRIKAIKIKGEGLRELEKKNSIMGQLTGKEG